MLFGLEVLSRNSKYSRRCSSGKILLRGRFDDIPKHNLVKKSGNFELDVQK